MSFISELRRRNVFRVAIAYVIVAWLVLQVSEVLIDLAKLPDWIGPTILWLLAIGFPIVLIVSWFYEITPEGITLEKDVDRSESVPRVSRRRFELILISLLIAAVILFAYDKWWIGGPTEQSIAVLPFVDMSPDKDHGYFSDGIAEELLNQLTKLRGLHVAGRTSSFSFKNKDVDLQEIAEKLNVAHILEGSVRTAGDRVRITVQLIKASDGFHLWSDTFDRDLTDIFAIQEETAKAVADVLSITLGVGEIDFGAGGTRNFEAYDAQLQARSLMLQANPANITAAIELLEKAVALDPDYANAWSLLSGAYLGAGFWTPDPAKDFFNKSKQAASRAMEIAPEAVLSLGAMSSQHMRNHRWLDAEQMLKKSLELAPAGLDINLNYGRFLTTVGRPSESMILAEQAVKTDPLSVGPSLMLHAAHRFNGDFDAALMELERGKGLIGGNLFLNANLLVTAMEAGDRELVEKYLDVVANSAPPAGRPFAEKMQSLLDSPEDARRELRRMYADAANLGSPPPGIIVMYASYFGDPELTLKILIDQNEKGRLGGVDTIWWPLYKEMRRLPGFKDLVRDLGLLDYWRNTGNWGEFCRPMGNDDFECE